MSIFEVDTTQDDLFKPYEPPVLSNGKHLFEIANDLDIQPTSNPDSSNLIIKIELRCQDETEDKGKPVFDNILVVTDTSTEKALKTKQIHQAKMAQFAVACGVYTKEQIQNGENIDLGLFKGRRCEAITKMETSKDQNGNSRQRSVIARYLFEGEDETKQ